MAQNLERTPRRILPLRDIALWGAETVGVATALGIAQQLGLTNIYYDIALSLANANVAKEALENLGSTFQNPDKLKPAAMGVGFITGVVTTGVLIPEVLSRLNGKINLSGTGDCQMVDGVRERDRNCVDGRIVREKQDAVEPGAGLMGGGFVRDNITALLIRNAFGTGVAQDFVIGYMLGRSLPTALVSAGITQLAAVRAVFENHLQGKGPVRENELPHDNAYGWSAVTSFLKHDLKFSKHNHETKARLLDALNKIDAFLNTVVWEPIMNVPAIITGFSSIINPNFGTTPIRIHHEKK